MMFAGIHAFFIRIHFIRMSRNRNVHDENGQKIKNIVRILPSGKFSI